MRRAEIVLVDTSALLALVSSSDRYHTAARETYDNLLEAGEDLWLTSYVLVEFGALAQNRLGFRALKAFFDSAGDVFQTVWVDAVMHREAWAEMENRAGRDLSLVDWTVLLAARRLGASVFTFDSDFFNEGVEVIPGVST